MSTNSRARIFLTNFSGRGHELPGSPAEEEAGAGGCVPLNDVNSRVEVEGDAVNVRRPASTEAGGSIPKPAKWYC